MIQRIQSIIIDYLNYHRCVCLSFFLMETKGGCVYFMSNIVYTILFGLSTSLSLLSILSFKKRQNQFVMNRLNMILNLILLGLFVCRTLSISGEAEVSEKGIGMFLPIVAIFLLVLANRAIKKDEDLVKSVDRLR